MAGAGGVMPSHFVTAAGMVPLSQLVPLQVMRAGPNGAAIPIEGAAMYPMPVFVQVMSLGLVWVLRSSRYLILFSIIFNRLPLMWPPPR